VTELIYLFIDSIPVSKHNVASQKACHESIPATFFAVHFALNEEERLVQGYKLGKIERVLFCCAVNNT
jgi:hypothetical protein